MTGQLQRGRCINNAEQGSLKKPGALESVPARESMQTSKQEPKAKYVGGNATRMEEQQSVSG
jgi:hypothetical protein